MSFYFLSFAKLFTLFTCGLISLYIIRHYIFTHARSLKKQRITYEDLRDSKLPSVSIMIPMHNEEGVVRNIFEILTSEDFCDIQVEIIAINDHSSDKTKDIVDEYVKKHPKLITPIHRYNRKNRGKPCGLNEALEIAKGDVCIIFDADYLPPKGIVQNFIVFFLSIYCLRCFSIS